MVDTLGVLCDNDAVKLCFGASARSMRAGSPRIFPCALRALPFGSNGRRTEVRGNDPTGGTRWFLENACG